MLKDIYQEMERMKQGSTFSSRFSYIRTLLDLTSIFSLVRCQSCKGKEWNLYPSWKVCPRWSRKKGISTSAQYLHHQSLQIFIKYSSYGTPVFFNILTALTIYRSQWGKKWNIWSSVLKSRTKYTYSQFWCSCIFPPLNQVELTHILMVMC